MIPFVRLLALTLSVRTRGGHGLSIIPAQRFFSHQPWLSVPGNPIIKWPGQVQPQLELRPPMASFPQQADEEEEEEAVAQNPTNLFQRNCATISELLRNHTLSGPTLEAALDQTSIKPCSALLQTIFQHFDSSPKPLFTVYLWAQKQPSFHSTPPLFNSMIDILGKARLFDLAWSLLLDRLRTNSDATSSLISADTFAVLIRRYSRAGMPLSSIRTFEFVRSLDPSDGGYSSNLDLLEILLDSLCKEGHVRVASDYLDRSRELKPGWVLPIRVYNILLNGWFRSRKLKRAERLWEEMRRENVCPTIVTYGTLVEGYCRMRRVEKAMELVDEMRKEGIEPNAIVYNPIVDALGEAGRFKEALSMMERFLVSDSGPTISTYNSLVKGFCKAGDLVGASRILKMMISRGFTPTPTTYNYFFRHFSKFGKIDEGMNLYTKMLESGYVPDRLTYHQLIKMLCEQERVDLAVQVSKEMRVRGIDLDLAVSTMLLHLLLKLHRFDDACEVFEDMLRRGIVPQYLTYRKLTEGLKKFGMAERARKLSDQMTSLPHSTKLPDTYKEGDVARELRSSIMKKAQAMSDILKTCKDPKELSNLRSSQQNVLANANRLVDNIRRKANGL